MRYLSYTLLAVIVIALIGWSISNSSTSTTARTSLDDKDYQRVNAYEIQEQVPIKLDFSSSVVTTKLLFYGLVDRSHADLVFDQASTENQTPYTRFSIEYRFGRTGQFQKVDLATRLTQYRSIENDQITPSYRVAEPKFKVTDSQSLELVVPENGAKTLELRLHSKEPELEGVVFRSYFRERKTLSDSERRWARLSRRNQNRLARFHPFGRHYLNKGEIQNVLSNRNQVIAPSGIAGQDFLERPLWSYQHPDLLISDTGVSSNASPNLGGGLEQSLRILEDSELEFGYQVLSAKPSIIGYRRLALNETLSQNELGSFSGEGVIKRSLPPGDYVFYANQPMRFEVEAADSIQMSERQRRFHMLDQSAISYSLLPSKSTQLLKLELIANADEELVLTYAFIDESEKILSESEHIHKKPRDPFTHVEKSSKKALSLRDETDRLSESSEIVLTVPTLARKLVVSLKPASSSGLLRVSNSLEALSAKSILSGDSAHYHSNWFEITPELKFEQSLAPKYSAINTGKTSVWVSNYGRYSFSPELVKPQVQRLRALKPSPIIDLLEPISLASEQPPSAIAYRQVEPNEIIDIELSSSTEGDSSLVLQALYRVNKQASTGVIFHIDKNSYSYDLYGESGQLILPPLSIGNHRFRIQASDDLTVFLNHLPMGVNNEPDAGFKKRQFIRAASAVSYSVSSIAQSDQTLQLLLANDRFTEPFNFAIYGVNSTGKRLIRRVEIFPDSASLKRLHALNANTSYWQLPVLYIPLGAMEGFVPDHLELIFNDDQPRLMSAAIIDRSDEKFSRAFTDRVDRASSSR